MASQNHTNFQPVPPIRTNTVDSQKSQSSGNMSPPASPASPTSRDFFGAITQRIRGRSRSRSRDAPRRPKSPMAMPPAQVQQASPARPSAIPVQSARPSVQDAGRRSTSSTSGSDPWRGRHSNDWLFNGYSVTATAKDLLQRRKS
ncbi:Nn.00g003920.m01.CDS01 [Neocucurbitaria sp. VM-36]